MTQPEQPQRRSYPYLSSSAWADLRKKLRGSIPKKIDKDYLHTVLGVSDKVAANVMPQLKTLGLIDDDNVPTELVHDFRDDDKYADACKAMIARVYPPGLTDAVQNPGEDLDAAVRWFMRQGAGEATAKIQARFYATLASGEVPEVSEKQPRKAPKAAAAPKPKTTDSANPAPSTPTSATAQSGANSSEHVRHGVDSSTGGPSLHVDLQIHISPDASTDQIDAIFASMAKHLYGR